jgi:glycosyltransferase involved in cell wall biosynthesis
VLSGEMIVCFAPDPWSGLWRNRHQIMTRLARRNTVVYVEPRVYLGQAARRLRARQTGWAELSTPRLRRERENLYIYTDPIYAPYAGRLSGGKITAAIRHRALRGALASLAASAPILWLLRPWDADKIGHYREKLVVYQVTDEYSDYPTVTDKAGFRASEEALLRRAGLVIVTSPALLAARSRVNPATHLVRNAVDFDGFQVALRERPELPRFAAIGHPRIGYAGALNEKIDFALLEGLARLRPDWQLILVGSLDLVRGPGEAEGLKALPNVHWLGRVPVTDVPSAIGGMDVCLLPYKLNAWTANIDSLKQYEYLACGKPAVATSIPAARDFPGLVRIAESCPDAFAQAVELELGCHSEELASARRNAVRGHTWDARVAQIEALLVERMAP